MERRPPKPLWRGEHMAGGWSMFCTGYSYNEGGMTVFDMRVIHVYSMYFVNTQLPTFVHQSQTLQYLIQMSNLMIW